VILWKNKEQGSLHPLFFAVATHVAKVEADMKPLLPSPVPAGFPMTIFESGTPLAPI
jgi:hypothetical protein